jgi:hypothetical protein
MKKSRDTIQVNDMSIVAVDATPVTARQSSPAQLLTPLQLHIIEGFHLTGVQGVHTGVVGEQAHQEHEAEVVVAHNSHSEMKYKRTVDLLRLWTLKREEAEKNTGVTRPLKPAFASKRLTYPPEPKKKNATTVFFFSAPSDLFLPPQWNIGGVDHARV